MGTNIGVERLFLKKNLTNKARLFVKISDVCIFFIILHFVFHFLISCSRLTNDDKIIVKTVAVCCLKPSPVRKSAPLPVSELMSWY